MNRIAIILAVLLLTCWISDPAMAQQRSAISPEEAKAIAKEAYIYGFPMVMGYRAIYTCFIANENPEYKGPLNKLSCLARLYTPERYNKPGVFIALETARHTPLSRSASSNRRYSAGSCVLRGSSSFGVACCCKR